MKSFKNFLDENNVKDIEIYKDGPVKDKTHIHNTYYIEHPKFGHQRVIVNTVQHKRTPHQAYVEVGGNHSGKIGPAAVRYVMRHIQQDAGIKEFSGIRTTGTRGRLPPEKSSTQTVKLKEDYVYKNNKGSRRLGDYVRHEFTFSPAGGQPPVNVHIHNEPKSKTGFVYIPSINGGVSSAGANRFGPAVVRQALPIIHKETGLSRLQGMRDTGAGPGRRQKIHIKNV